MLAKSVKIHGYVTSIKSANEFEIDEYRITKDATLTLELEKSDDPEEMTTVTPEEIRVGTELEIRGDLNEATNQLTAKVIKVNLSEHLHLKRTALMEVPGFLDLGSERFPEARGRALRNEYGKAFVGECPLHNNRQWGRQRGDFQGIQCPFEVQML